MKKIAFTIVLIMSVSCVYAVSTSTCVDLQKTLVSGSESSEVLLLQNFLMQKGILKATPNGYFGPATLSAVKSYQKSVGIFAGGAAAPLTRAAIKKETCTNLTPAPNKVLPKSTSIASVIPKSASPLVVKPVSTSTSIKPKACTQEAKICPNGTSVGRTGPNCEFAACPNVLATTTLNTKPLQTVVPQVASTSQIKPLSATSTVALSTGQSPQVIKKIILPVPVISSIDKATFISGGTMTVPMVIKGSGFSTTSNTITLKLQNSFKTYPIGTYISNNGTTTSVKGDFTTKTFPCGEGCVETLPSGNYDVTVKTDGGESNAGYISIKSITVTSASGSIANAVRQQSTQSLIGSISLSSSAPVSLESISLSLKGAVTSKVTNFKLKDDLTGKIISGGGTFSLGSIQLLEYESKIYSIYADVNTPVSGSFTVDATLSVKDYIGKNTIQVKIPQFLVTISG